MSEHEKDIEIFAKELINMNLTRIEMEKKHTRLLLDLHTASSELNAARALLREVLDDGVFRQKHISLLKVVGADWGDKVRAYLDACDKPGEPDAS